MRYPKLLVLNCERIVCVEWVKWANEEVEGMKEVRPDLSRMFEGWKDYYLKYIKDNERKIILEMCREVMTGKKAIMAAAMRPPVFFEGMVAIASNVFKRLTKNA